MKVLKIVENPYLLLSFGVKRKVDNQDSWVNFLLFNHFQKFHLLLLVAILQLDCLNFVNQKDLKEFMILNLQFSLISH
jgi:hypothetical protein